MTVSQNDVGTFLGVVGGVKFSVFRYRYEMVAPLVALGQPFAGCRLAAFRDLAAMKLAAVMARATKRDYVDLHALLTLAGMSLAEMLEAFRAKFPDADPRPALRAMTYFVDVDKQRMPIMETGSTWEEVKAGLLAAAEGSPTTPKAKRVRKPTPKPSRRR